MGASPTDVIVADGQQQQLNCIAVEQEECDVAALLQNVTVQSHAQDTAAQPPQGPHQIAAGCGVDKAQHSWAAAQLKIAHRAVWDSGVCCVLVAAFIFAIAAVLVKLTGNRVPVLEITLLRSSISLVISVVLIKARDIKPVMGNRQNIKWLIPRGLFGAVAMTTFYAAILLLPLADGMTLFFLNPCLTAIAAWAIRGEPLGLLGLAGCLCSLVGVVVLIHPPMLFGGHANWGPMRLWGTGFGLVSAICCAGAFICIRFIGKSEPAIVVALYFHASTMLISTGPLAFGWPQALQPLSWFDAALLLGVAAGSFLGQLFMTRGLQLENASLISSLNFSQVLYSYIFGIVFFSEHLSAFGIFGSILVASGMVCVTIRPRDGASGSEDTAQHQVQPSISERARRLDSFKRLLSRARAAPADDASLHDQAEGMPLTSSGGRAASHSAGSPVQVQLIGMAAGRDHQQQQQQHHPPVQDCLGGQHAGVAVLVTPGQEGQAELQQEWLPSSIHLPCEVAETSVCMHHRHAVPPAAVPPSGTGQTSAVAAQQHVPQPSGMGVMH